MTPLDRMCNAYWEAFRQGYFKVGGRPEDYPDWAHAPAAVKEETRRCMRHAVEALRIPEIARPPGHEGDWVQGEAAEMWNLAITNAFPEPLVKRGQPMTQNDAAFVTSQKIARLGE